MGFAGAAKNHIVSPCSSACSSLGDMGLYSLSHKTCIFTLSNNNALRWMPWDLTDNKSTLVQVMAWCRQATSHYLSQCWPSSMSPYGITRPQRVNLEAARYKLRIGWAYQPFAELVPNPSIVMRSSAFAYVMEKRSVDRPCKRQSYSRKKIRVWH